MDRVRLAVAAGLLLAGLAAPSSSAVADDAFLSFISLSASSGFEDQPQPGVLRAQMEPTDDAPAGPIAGRVEFLVEDLGGVRPPQRFDAPFAFDVGTPGPGVGEIRSVDADWAPEPGLYNVTATLWADGAAAPWDTRWMWHAAGRTPALGTGWGHVRFPAASAFDLDSDGTDDLWLADNKTGTPADRGVDAYETLRVGSHVAEWSSQCGRGLILEFFGPDSPVTDVRLSASVVELLMPGDTLLSIDTQSRGGPPPEPVEGNYTLTLGAQYYGTRSDAIFLARGCTPPPPRLPHTWGDGYRTTANVTHWDLDEDGAMDVRFWHTDAASVEEARGEATDERRATELVLIAQAHVEQRTTRRVLTFELARPGGGHEGAWVEVQDAAGLFRALLGAPDNASISYRLSLPANESFVEQEGNTTWAWIGHFSTQTLAVILDAAPDEGEGSEDQSTTEDTSSSSSPSGSAEVQDRKSPIAGQGMLVALAAVAAALVARQALGRR